MDTPNKLYWVSVFQTQMEETRKRQPSDGVGVDDGVKAVKKPRADGPGDLEEDDIVAWLLMDGDDDDAMGVGELMEFLDRDAEAATSTTAAEVGSSRVKFIDNPYSSSLIFQSSSSHITINGNEESCGSSFSNCDSSVMASVDMGGFANSIVSNKLGGGACISNEEKARGGMVEQSGGGEILGEGSMDGCNGLDWMLDDDGGGLAWVLGEDFFL